MTLPPPPVPSDADLRPLPFMPLHVAKLRDSDLAAECEPEACWYAVLLWCAAWHQLPAGSLPNNDTVLCKLIGLGRDLKTFRTHRDEALRGWYEASDGRLYHPVVAQEVVKAWRARVEQFWRTECARIKKANQRNGTDDPTPSLEEFLAGRAPATRDALSQGTLDLVPEDMADRPQGQEAMSLGKTSPRERDTEGTQKGQGDSGITQQPDSARKIVDEDDCPISKSDLIDLTARLCRVGSVQFSPLKLGPYTREIDHVRGWLKDEIDVEATILPAIADQLARTSQDRIASLAFYDAAVRKRHAAKAKAFRAAEAVQPQAEPWDQHDASDERIAKIRTGLNGNHWHRSDKVALLLEWDGDDPRVIVGARTSLVAERLDRGTFWDLARAAFGASVEVEVRQL